MDYYLACSAEVGF